MKRILIHLSLGIILLFSLVYFSLQRLEKMTLHGKSILIPDMRSFSISEVEDTLETLNLRFSVVDSGAYNASYPRGSVIEQRPKFGSRVKKDRVLFLTLNPKNVSLIELPNYVDKSSRQYISELKAKGFRIGKFVYKKDVHANVVLGIRHDGQKMKISDKLEKSSKIDLILGDGGGKQIQMPNLLSEPFDKIRLKLQNLSLNAGEFYYDATVVDTMSSFVYKQFPEVDNKAVDLGSMVLLWFTEDSSKLRVDTVEIMRQDSIKARLDSLLND